MDYEGLRYLIWAAALGAISAVSLPLGSAVALRTRSRPMVISTLAAFGAGALIASLSVELVAPTLFALDSGGQDTHSGDPIRNFYFLVLGAILGGILYVLLDQLVNAHGGFLRRTATSVAYFNRRRHRRTVQLIEELARFPLLSALSSDHTSTLISMVRPVTFNDGDVVLKQGDEPADLLFILKGTVRVISDRRTLAELGPGEVVGLGMLVLQIPNIGSGFAVGDMAGLALARKDFERLREISPEFDRACRDLTVERSELIKNQLASHREKAEEWISRAAQAVKTGSAAPNTDELRLARDSHAGAPLAIWLGILIDGIPESFVVGAGLLVTLRMATTSLADITFGQVVPYTLIAGLFLSNFPEALASSANMRLQGWGSARIFSLWLSLMILTSIGSGFGFLLADSLGPGGLTFAEGLAAGAMLTMIAAAMVPEAVHMGSANIVGISTLAGFLAACSFKLLE